MAPNTIPAAPARTLTPEQLADIAAREAAATKGPWTAQGEYPFLVLQAPPGTPTDDIPGLFSTNLAGAAALDAEFIAAARTDVAALLAEVERQAKRIAELESSAQKLVDGWKQSSEDHAEVAKSKVMDAMPGFASKQEGRSLQLLDCSDELADVLKGEDPDEWQYGVGMDVLDRSERDTEAAGGAQ